MKQLITKEEYIESGENGIRFVKLTPKQKKAINKRLVGVRQRVIINSIKAREEASKIHINR